MEEVREEIAILERLLQEKHDVLKEIIKSEFLESEIEKKFSVLGEDLEHELSNNYIITATLDDAYGSMSILTRDPMDLLRFIDAESQYSVTIAFRNEDYSDHYYNIEIEGRILLP